MKIRILIFLAFLFIFSTPVRADIANPDYFSLHCNRNEIEATCRWSRASFDSPMINGCAHYENNPDYRFLTGTGGTFGGDQKYCFVPSSLVSLIDYHLRTLAPIFFTTLLFEMPVFLLFGFRGRRAILSILAANFISVPLFYLATIWLPFTGFYALCAMEIIIVIFETLFIRYQVKTYSFEKVFLSTLAANAVSAIFGSTLLLFLNI